MNIIECRALRGPNRYSRHPAVFMLLDIGEFEDLSSEKIPGFTDRLLELLPSLQGHRCSVGEPGGFIQRLRRGTWMGHIVEHVALELQCLAGMEVGFGKTLGTSQRGIYRVVYRYRLESAGLLAGREAVALLEAVVEDRQFDVADVTGRLAEQRGHGVLGPSTESIVREAQRRGIPAQRLNESSFVRLAYGNKQRRIQATMTDRTSALGVEIADSKFWTKTILTQAGIPAAAGSLVTSLEEAEQAAEELGFPVAIKPEVGNHGRGITARVSDAAELKSAFGSASRVCAQVIVEKTLSGFDFRMLVIGGELVAASLREPAHVTGDGTSSIQQLIDRVNADPRRGVGHERSLTRIDVDEMTDRLMVLRGYSVGDVLPAGTKLYLKSTANLSSGGTASDVTGEVHQDVRLMCERIARLIGLDCIGIDIVAPGIHIPLESGVGGVVEVNAAPGFRMHLDPTKGEPRDVAKAFVEMLFPAAESFEVPIVAVTGTNGKTTTSKLIAHALKYGGAMVGFAGTTGVEIDGVSVIVGDYSGPEGAAMVLSEPTVDHAVLEVARGGIVRRGLGFSECHVGILLNVDKDHIGTDGVDDIEELSLVKSAVIEVANESGIVVLNADDPTVVGLAHRARGRVIYFSLSDDSHVVRQHLDKGGVAVVVEAGAIVIQSTDPPLSVLPVIEAPITLRGAAAFNTANVLAAVAALHGLGVPVDLIRNGVRTFHPSGTQNPGRMNVIDFVTFKVIIDYAHNPPAVKALGKALALLTEGRKIAVAHGTGSRVDDSIEELGAVLATVYDHIIVTEIDPRYRDVGETTELVRSGAIDAGFSSEQLEIIVDPLQAIDRAFELVEAGDLIVIQVDEVEPMLARVMAHFERLRADGQQ